MKTLFIIIFITSLIIYKLLYNFFLILIYSFNIVVLLSATTCFQTSLNLSTILIVEKLIVTSWILHFTFIYLFLIVVTFTLYFKL